MHCVRDDCFSAFGVGEVDQCRRENTAIFLELACTLIAGLLLGVGMGSFFPVLLHVWRWHKTTRLADHNQTER
jgi:uncharacterized membrane protein